MVTYNKELYAEFSLGGKVHRFCMLLLKFSLRLVKRSLIPVTPAHLAKLNLAKFYLNTDYESMVIEMYQVKIPAYIVYGMRLHCTLYMYSRFKLGPCSQGVYLLGMASSIICEKAEATSLMVPHLTDRLNWYTRFFSTR